jgi:hypothetical protein
MQAGRLATTAEYPDGSSARVSPQCHPRQFDFYGGAWDRVGIQKMVGSMFSPVIGTLDFGLSAALSAPLYSPLYSPLSLPWPAAFGIGSPGQTAACSEQ